MCWWKGKVKEMAESQKKKNRAPEVYFSNAASIERLVVGPGRPPYRRDKAYSSGASVPPQQQSLHCCNGPFSLVVQ